MKRFTQNDLRKMYEAPPQALTEHIHETISFLPVHRQEEKNVNKKLRFSIIITAALVIVLMATALAGAVNESFNAMLYKTWPAFARMLMPIEQGNPTAAARRRPVPASLATYSRSFLAIPDAISGTRLVDIAIAMAVGTLIIVSTSPEYNP